MKIEQMNIKDKIKFEDVKIGQVFEICGDIYMKISYIMLDDEDEIDCICLENGRTDLCGFDTEVILHEDAILTLR